MDKAQSTNTGGRWVCHHAEHQHWHQPWLPQATQRSLPSSSPLPFHWQGLRLHPRAMLSPNLSKTPGLEMLYPNPWVCLLIVSHSTVTHPSLLAAPPSLFPLSTRLRAKHSQGRIWPPSPSSCECPRDSSELVSPEVLWGKMQ